jgi:hypothetical protein
MSSSADVRAIVVNEELVYMGGFFGTVGGELRRYLAAVDATTGALTPWNPDPAGPGGVKAIVLRGGTVYFGGGFTSVGGHLRSRIAAVDAVTGSVTPWDPNAGGVFPGIGGLQASRDAVYAAGDFQRLCERPQSFIASLGGLTSTGVPLEQMSGGAELRSQSVEACPNPARGEVVVRFFVPRAQWLRLDVFDVSGRLVRVLEEGMTDDGDHVQSWAGSDQHGSAVASGVYFLRLTDGRSTKTCKVVLRR